VTEPLTAYAPFPGEMPMRSLGDVDLAWLLNQPASRIAADVWQLLWRLNQQVPFVNDVTGLMMLNNKNNLPLLVPPEHLPATLVSNDFGEMWRHQDARPAARWVVKPSNAGCGADVFVLEPGSTNNRALLQSMTGNATAGAAMTRSGLEGLQSRYCVLQEFMPHAEEKRIAIAGGRPVAQQVKRLAAGDHRGNVTQEATFDLAELDTAERQLAERVGECLMRHGIRFAGIDVAYPAVFEVNLVNPGGLVEAFELGQPESVSCPHIARILETVPGLADGASA
jgi:glutathione synthase